MLPLVPRVLSSLVFHSQALVAITTSPIVVWLQILDNPPLALTFPAYIEFTHTLRRTDFRSSWILDCGDVSTPRPLDARPVQLTVNEVHKIAFCVLYAQITIRELMTHCDLDCTPFAYRLFG